MKTTLLRVSCAACVGLTALIGCQAQAKKPMPSPPADTSQTVDGKTVSIHYNAPSMRGRKIFGGLVPYDKVWRTGANPATALKTEVNLKIGTATVPAGSYTLWTLRPKYTAEQAIDLVAGAGYDGFELVDEDKKWSQADVRRIRARMTQLGIVCDAMSGIKTGFADAGAAQKLADELTARMTQAE